MYLFANPGGGRGGGGSGGGMGRGRSGRDMGLVGKTIRIVMGPYKVCLYLVPSYPFPLRRGLVHTIYTCMEYPRFLGGSCSNKYLLCLGTYLDKLHCKKRVALEWRLVWANTIHCLQFYCANFLL